MDAQFNTLIRSYHDNFLEYKMTGSSSYQQSYKSAQEGIDTILSSMDSQNSTQKKEIKDFYDQDVEGNIRNLHSQRRDTQKKILSGNDQVISAEMRSQTTTQSIPSQTPSMTNRYIALGVMFAAAYLLG